MSPLAQRIRALIQAEGPLPLDRYMALCLGDPEHGYYMNRDPLGAAGDFTTSPEISQVFGELLGVWVAQTWVQMGSPREVALVELGPGRGTLMADMLRVVQKVPALAKAARIHFVETSPALREAQRQRVPQATWHSSIASLPGLPSLVVANEFFDALPIRQLERKGGRLFERCVMLAGDAFAVGLVPALGGATSQLDGIYEDATLRNALATSLGHHLNTVSGAGLIVDYGHLRHAAGDTLQAMKGHQFVGILEHMGEADLTSHVDFEGLARGFMAGGAKIAGVMTQGNFLRAMGLEARTDVLASKADAEARALLLSASKRLAHDSEMGELFKVIVVTDGRMPRPYPFGAA